MSKMKWQQDTIDSKWATQIGMNKMRRSIYKEITGGT